jgi:hypothetical protein
MPGSKRYIVILKCLSQFEWEDITRRLTSVKLTGTSFATRFPTVEAFFRISTSNSRVSFRFASTFASSSFLAVTKSSAGCLAYKKS